MFNQQATPKDVFAILVILIYGFLAWKGVATMLNGAVLIIVGFYFGSEHQKLNTPTE